MMQINMLDEFLVKMKEGNNSFAISYPEEKTYYYFILNTIGDATYVYGNYSFMDELFYTRCSFRPELVAIASNDMVYIINEFFFSLRARENAFFYMPENVMCFSDYCEEVRDYANSLLLELYDDLEITEPLNEETLAFCKEEARNMLLSRSQKFPELPSTTYTGDEVAMSLSGMLDLAEETAKRFEKCKDEWIQKKAINEAIIDFADDYEDVPEWERKISQSLRDVCSKMISVEFEFNGKTQSGKVDSDIVLQKLNNGSSFTERDFASVVHGNSTLQNLGCNILGIGENALKCCHIKRIQYNRQMLFSR